MLLRSVYKRSEIDQHSCQRNADIAVVFLFNLLREEFKMSSGILYRSFSSDSKSNTSEFSSSSFNTNTHESTPISLSQFTRNGTTGMAKTKVLVVEDYRPLAETLEYQLGRAGYEVYRASDGREALHQAKLILPDVVFLDVDLPVLSGIEVCKHLRADPSTRDVLILMLSALGEESDQVVGFAMGADDYVVKPVESYRVLLQRLKALLRRREPVFEESDSVSRHGVTVDRRRFVAKVNDEILQLTKSEFRLLETLIRQPGRAFGRNELVDAALGEDTMVLERTIDVHVRALRKKMGDQAELVETVRGVGYRFKE